MKTATQLAEPERRVTCRYLRRSDEQCTGEVTDEHAEILLCQKHLARALALIRASMRKTGITTAPPATRERHSHA